MIPSSLSALTAHLWQSTCFVAAAWLLTRALGKDRAAVRYRIWLAASVKFLVPFSLLINLGTHIAASTMWRTAPVIVPQRISFVIEEVSQPFVAMQPAYSQPSVSPQAATRVPALLMMVWCCGFLIGVAYWLRWWRQIRATRRRAAPLDLDLPIEVKSSPGRLEPGVLGIWRPVLLLPDGITERLTPQQFDAVLAHELCHVRRRDNLTAAIHMIVETVFWFYPLVWWIRTRLVEERERACDEEVLRSGKPSMAYAEGILEVCKHYVESPLVCVSGISGANLRKRIESIMENPLMSNLSLSKKLLIVAAGILTLVTPVAIGLLGSRITRAEAYSQSAAPAAGALPPAVVSKPQPTFLARATEMITARENSPAPRAQTPAGLPQFTTSSLAVAQVSPGNQPFFGQGPGGIIYKATKFSDLIRKAWPVAWYQVVWPASWSNGGPPWSVGIQARYDLTATFPPGTTPEQLQLMLQGLFANSLKLAAHWETQTVPVYALTISAGGVKFQAAAGPSHPRALLTVTPASYEFKPRFPNDPVPGPSGATIDQISQLISARLDKPVVNLTGLNGVYDIDMVVARNPSTAPNEPYAGWSALGPRVARAGAPFTSPDDQYAGWNNAAYISALEMQLGLTVTEQTLPIRMLVIDNLQLAPATAQ